MELRMSVLDVPLPVLWAMLLDGDGAFMLD